MVAVRTTLMGHWFAANLTPHEIPFMNEGVTTESSRNAGEYCPRQVRLRPVAPNTYDDT